MGQAAAAAECSSACNFRQRSVAESLHRCYRDAASMQKRLLTCFQFPLNFDSLWR